MKIAKTFRISYKALKVRTSLTILMVIVGSGLMVALNGIVEGLGRFVTDIFNKLAPDILFVSSFPLTDSSSDSNNGSGGENNNNNNDGNINSEDNNHESIETREDASEGTPSFLSPGLVSVPTIILDQTAVKKIESLQHVSKVIPSFQGRIIVSAENRSQSVNVLSLPPEQLKIIAPAVEFVQGSHVGQQDKSVIYLPLSVVDRLWKHTSEGDESSSDNQESVAREIGHKVNVTYIFIDPRTTSQQSVSETLTMAGIMKPVGNPTIDTSVVLNLDEGNKLLHKSGHYDSLFVAADDPDHVDEVKKEIQNIYGPNIGITTSKAILKSIQEFTAGFGSVVYSIALVALLVGSVGIVTTMYTSVTERTKEIGIMKAIGARDRNVLALFLSETTIIGIIGASIGIIVGIIGGYIILLLFASKLPSPGVTHYPLFDLIRVWGISIGLSIVAGLYPAWKAAKLSPISALRRD